MPAERRYGMDHSHYEWSPIVDRAPISWPGEARVALAVVVSLQYLEWAPPHGSFQPTDVYNRPLPDYRGYSHRQYGHRVGIFRILQTLAELGIPATIAIDAMTERHFPWLTDYCVRSGAEIIGHGVSASRVVSSRMSEDDERRHIDEAIAALRQATGETPAGWLSAEYGESERTPALLAQAGIRYLCDWGNDEQPYRITPPSGDLVSLPLLLDLNDKFAMSERGYPIGEYTRLIVEAFQTIHADAAESGRTLAFNLHPWISGQPFRIRYIAEALRHIMEMGGVWPATGSQIVNCLQEQQPTISNEEDTNE